MRIVITGATGTLGGALAAAGGREGEVLGISRTRAALPCGAEWRAVDVRSREAVDEFFVWAKPDLVINCAAVVGDWKTTAQGAVHVSAAAAKQGARLVHISTDAVFGSRPEPYREDDLPCPATPYGAAKAAAELAISQLHPDAAIVRTSLIIGSQGRTQRERVVHEAVTAPQAGHVFFTDDIRSPVSLSDLVDAVWEIARDGRPGTHHVARSLATSWPP